MTALLKNMKYRHLIIGCIITFFISMVSCKLMRLDDSLSTFIITCLTIYGYPVIWIIYNFIKSKSSIRVVMGHTKFKISEIISAAIFPELLGLGILFLVTAIIVMFIPMEEESELVSSTTNWMTTVLGTAILAPICEEVIFRGFLLNKMLTKYSPLKAIIFSSVIFGILHLNNGISPTIVGLVLGIFFMKYKSIVPGIAIHSLHNFIVVLLKYLAFGNNSSDTISDSTMPEPMFLIMLSIILIVVGLLYILRFIKRNWKYVQSFKLVDFDNP